MDNEGLWSENCANTPCPSDIALLEAIDGEANTTTLTHLQTCPQCVRRVARMRWLQEELRIRLYRLFCPSSDVLLEYRQGWLSDEARQRVMQHLAACPYCSAELQLLGQSVGVVEAPHGPGRFVAARPVR